MVNQSSNYPNVQSHDGNPVNDQPFQPSPRWLQDLYPGREGYTELLMASWRAHYPDQQLWAVPLFAHANYLSKLFESLHNEVLKPLNLNYSDYAVLITLLLIVGPEGATPKELNRVLLQTSAGMTKLLARLDRTGLIRRQPNPRDKRSIVVGLSAQGEECARQASQLVVTQLYQKLAWLEQIEPDRLLQSLDLLVKGLVAAQGTPTRDDAEGALKPAT